MRKSAARRLVEYLEHDLAVHREMLDFVQGPAAPETRVPPERGHAGSLCLAARLRDAVASALSDADRGGAALGFLESLPADEAARVAELRRELEAVLAALHRGGRTGRGPGPLPA